jgi:glycerol kinase
VERIYADGGMTVNARLMQSQADLLGKTLIVRERDTCWGVAKGVLTAVGKSVNEFKDQKVQVYAPRVSEQGKFEEKYERWCKERLKFYGWQ